MDSYKSLPKGENDSGGWIYLIKNESTLLFKIGITVNLKRRVRQIQNIGGCKCTVIAAVELTKECPKKEDIEKDIHILFDHKRIVSEWFELTELQKETAKEIIKEMTGQSLVINNKLVYGNLSS